MAEETLAAIIADMRYRADNHRQDGWESVGEELDDLADRIDAAVERERDAFCQLCQEKDAAYDRLLLERDKAIKERTPGNASSCAPMSLDEAIKHAEERADGSPCGQAHAQLAGWLRELRDLRNAPGNAAAMREALDKAECVLLVAARFATDNAFADADARENLRDVDWDGALAEIDAALSAPARNCDRFEDGPDALFAYKDTLRDGEEVRVPWLLDWLFEPAKGGRK